MHAIQIGMTSEAHLRMSPHSTDTHVLASRRGAMRHCYFNFRRLDSTSLLLKCQLRTIHVDHRLRMQHANLCDVVWAEAGWAAWARPFVLRWRRSRIMPLTVQG